MTYTNSLKSSETYSEDSLSPSSSSRETCAGVSRHLIRKKQNRDSARRCRQRRKEKTTDIYDMLVEQRNLIKDLDDRVQKLDVKVSQRRQVFVKQELQEPVNSSPVSSSAESCELDVGSNVGVDVSCGDILGCDDLNDGMLPFEADVLNCWEIYRCLPRSKVI